MKKRTDEIHDRLSASRGHTELFDSHTAFCIDIGCGAALWICGAALSTMQLALQETSHDVLLENWQDVSLAFNIK
jgi:hypothetical protein